MAALLFLGACASEPAPSPPTVPEDADEILEAAISYFADQYESLIAVVDTSLRVSFLAQHDVPNPDSLFLFYEIPDSALLSVFSREVPSGYPVPLGRRDDVIRPPVFPDRPTREDYAALPRARALALSRPALSGDGATALLEYIVNCNAVLRALCGSGGLLLLNQRDGEWVVVHNADLWVA